MIIRLDELPVGPMPPPQTRLVNQRLVKLAGHGRLVDATTAKESNRAAEPAPTNPAKILADLGQRRISQVGHTNAAYVVILPAQRFGHEHWVAPPSGQQTYSFDFTHAA